MLTPDGRTNGRKDENYIPLDILHMPGYNQDLFSKLDLDFWDCFGREKPLSYN